MTHRIAPAIAALLLVVAPVAASAKGPVAATVAAEDGSRIELGSSKSSWDEGDPFVRLMESTHALSAIFRTDPSILTEPPTGVLGPRFEITWDLGLVDRGEPTHLVRQDAYPYAEGGAVTFVPPGQALYGADETWGGWYSASPELPAVLEELGLAPPAVDAGGAVRRVIIPGTPAPFVVALTVGLLMAMSVRSRPATR